MYEMANELIGQRCTFTLATQFPQSGVLVAVQGKLAKIEVGKNGKEMYINLDNLLYIEPQKQKD